MQAIDILKKYWGYTSFKPKQEEIINSLVEKKDTLALLPTAGGKSLCFQIPSLMSEGICLVISPLISLMIDQTKFLKSKGINSIAISSQMNFNEIDTALTNCIYGNIKFLYISPEKLRNKQIIDKIDKMKINLIAIDEAHCISEWGHNFRPSYRLINEIRKIKLDTPILALTATANQNVINDIQTNLNFKEDNLIKSTFFRNNLSYVTIDCKNKNQTLLNLCKKIKSSIIIYVRSRRESNDISSFLNKNSISSASYHAGIDNEQRNRIQKSWTENNIRVIVATNSFGMGINKLDVRLIVHYNIPNSIESYFQESGRAGRDSKTAYSFILYNKQDILIAYKDLNDRFPSKVDLQNTYQKICDYLQIAVNTLPDEEFNFSIKDFCSKYKLDIKKTYNSIKFLENEELITLSNVSNKSSKVKILLSNTDLYKFQIANVFYDRIIKILLRKYPNIFKNYVNINEDEIDNLIKSTNQNAREIFSRLDKKGVISYQQNLSDNTLRFIQLRKDAEDLEFTQSNIEKEKNKAKNKIEQVINYIKEKKKCKHQILLDYFDEKLEEKCNICDNCVRKNKDKMKVDSFKKYSQKIIKILEKKESSLAEIDQQINLENKEILKNIINYLFDNDFINKFGDKYILNNNKKFNY